MAIPDIDKWERENPKEESYLYPDGKNICINLAKALPSSYKKFAKEKNEEALKSMATFFITREAFVNKNLHFCKYIDHFIEFYDKEKELPMIYLHLKTIIDDGKLSLTKNEYVKTLYRQIFKESSIKEHIYQLVEDNYKFDVTRDKKTGREFIGPDDFTNDNVRRLLAISMMMKMVIIPTEHYMASTELYQSGELSDLMLSIFVDMIYKVGDTSDEDEADELVAKLYKFTSKQLQKHVKGNRTLWEQQNALRGVTEESHLDTLLVKYLLTDNFFKFQFDDNVVSFIKSIIETQLFYTINIIKYKLNPIRVDQVKGPEGLSSVDKIEQAQIKIDETRIIRSDKATVDIMRDLEESVGPISEAEIAYYTMTCLEQDKFHAKILFDYFAHYFGGYTELQSMSNRKYMKLIIIMKRKLIAQGYTQLPWLISSGTRGKLSNRMLRNTKFLNKLKSSETYQNLINKKYSALKGYKEDEPLIVISKVINNAYTFAEFAQPELTGEIIEFDPDIIADELLNYMNNEI